MSVEIEQELKAARELQMSLLPKRMPSIPGYQFTARFLPAREVSGDLYDLIRIDDHRLGLLVGDVTGKGIPAAILMAAAKDAFNLIAKRGSSPEIVMEEVNRNLIQRGSSRFVAACYGVLDLERKSISISSAGLIPFIWSADLKECLELDRDCFSYPLGITSRTKFKRITIPLGKGDLILFHTDGVVEAQNEEGEPFGYDRLQQLLGELAGLSADEIADSIIEEVSRWSKGTAHDDITLLVVKAVDPNEWLRRSAQLESDQFAGEPEPIPILLRGGRRYRIEGERISIGKDEENDIPIHHQTVAPKHALIRREEDRFKLVDLNSRFGTFINGERVYGEAELKDGDVVAFGDVEFRFIVERHSSAPGDAQGHFLRGVAYHKAGEMVKAEREYLEALKADPNFAPAYFNLGVIAHDGGDLEEAIRLFEKGVSIDPNDALAHANLGKLYEEKGMWERAIREGEKAAQLDPSLLPDVIRRRERIKRKAEMQREMISLPREQLEGWRVMRVMENDLFRIELTEGITEEEIETVIRILREAYREIGSDLGCFPGKIWVSISRPPHDEAHPVKAVGCFDGEKIRLSIPTGRGDYGVLRGILRHEYSHLLVQLITSGNCPAWLNEGVAEFESREMLGYEREELRRMADSGDLPSLKELFKGGEDRISYLLAHAVVERIVREKGMQAIRELLRGLGRGEDIPPEEFESINGGWQTELADSTDRP